MVFTRLPCIKGGAFAARSLRVTLLATWCAPVMHGQQEQITCSMMPMKPSGQDMVNRCCLHGMWGFAVAVGIHAAVARRVVCAQFQHGYLSEILLDCGLQRKVWLLKQCVRKC